MPTTDWAAIESDFASGLSLRSLSARYGLSKSVIHRHFNKPPEARDTEGTTEGQVGTVPLLPLTTDIVALAKRLIVQLALIAVVPLDLKEHNLIANALSQYNKIMITAPAGAELPRGTDWSIFSKEELDVIQPIFLAAETRVREKEKETNITPIRNNA